jgi:transposase
MPEGHQKQLEWTPERLVRWAASSGPYTERLIQEVLQSRPHPQQAFNACMGIMRLSKSFSPPRLEAACRRALHFGTSSYRSVESILKHGLDQQPLPESQQSSRTPDHGNLRGATYYH